MSNTPDIDELCDALTNPVMARLFCVESSDFAWSVFCGEFHQRWMSNAEYPLSLILMGVRRLRPGESVSQSHTLKVIFRSSATVGYIKSVIKKVEGQLDAKIRIRIANELGVHDECGDGYDKFGRDDDSSAPSR